MRLIDMSLPIPATEAGKATVNRGVLRIDSPTRPYEALIYDFAFTSEAGTYIDLPGHIVETGPILSTSRLRDFSASAQASFT